MEDAKDAMLYHAIIPPPLACSIERSACRTVRVVVDSSMRDMTLWPTPATYEVDVEEDLLQVTSAELLAAKVPLSAHVIPASACSLSVRGRTGDVVVVAVPPGDYDAVGLAAVLELALADGVPGQTWGVQYDPVADGFWFQSSELFAVLGGQDGRYTAGSMARALGLDRREHASTVDSSSGLHVVKSPFRKDLDQHMYAVLHLQHVCLNKSAYPLLNKSMAVFTGNSVAAYNYFSPQNRIKKALKPAVPRISRLRICFRGRDGEPYDFRNMDHVLEFAFEVPKHLQRYNV